MSLNIEELKFSLKELRAGYLSKAFSPEEVFRECLRRIESWADPALFIQASEWDFIESQIEALKSKLNGDLSSLPLYGIPFAVKDNIDVAGLATTAACPGYKFNPEKNAFVVQLLMNAGAICIGKTNMDQFATGLVGIRSPYGVARNAYNDKLIPGGSSSGSASAVSAGLCTFSLGTDTAGSGRVPAALQILWAGNPQEV